MARSYYQVNEIFTSVQGEGYWTGTPATFIRLQGCTVGCPWCDSGPLADATWGRQTNGLTRNTWGKGGERMTVRAIVDQVKAPHVVVTGGEPTLYNLDPLLHALRRHFVQLETSGQNALKGELQPDWVTWSPKENIGWNAPEELKALTNEVKWVVDDTLQWETVEAEWLWFQNLTLNDRTHKRGLPWVYLMPEGCPPRPEMVAKTLAWLETCYDINKGYHFRFGDRLQYRIGVR